MLMLHDGIAKRKLAKLNISWLLYSFKCKIKEVCENYKRCQFHRLLEISFLIVFDLY